MLQSNDEAIKYSLNLFLGNPAFCKSYNVAEGGCSSCSWLSHWRTWQPQVRWHFYLALEQNVENVSCEIILYFSMLFIFHMQ